MSTGYNKAVQQKPLKNVTQKFDRASTARRQLHKPSARPPILTPRARVARPRVYAHRCEHALTHARTPAAHRLPPCLGQTL